MVQWILSYRHNRCIDKDSYVLLHKIVAMHKITLHYINCVILKRIKLNFIRQVDGNLCVLCGEINVEIMKSVNISAAVEFSASLRMFHVKFILRQNVFVYLQRKLTCNFKYGVS